MPLSTKQLALIHVAKAKLGITEDQYRACLVQIAGVESSKDLDRGGFEALMGFFEYMGFKPLNPRGAVYGDRPGFASSAQVQLIRELWFEYTGGGQDDTLNKWLLRTFKVSSLRFLKMEQARKAITALKAMKTRAA
ncbi:regulatory protein GemA [Meridianimarinicoccus sp. RP-17]|uniref:regulatory protein GemA n=1 Tax=Meridianimarinicoccus zhengii TaxID=2056810 RepID=UPI000DABA6F6|nr:regulatory protein GemA [Phycocomes zhengii]